MRQNTLKGIAYNLINEDLAENSAFYDHFYFLRLRLNKISTFFANLERNV
jgi:hypothetical protein